MKLSRRRIPDELVAEANRERFTRGRCRPGARRAALVCDGKVAGFFTPHFAADGSFRIGPVFVKPEYRRRGLVRALLMEIDVPMIACIETSNAASAALFESAGFVRKRRYANGWWYWRPRRNAV